MKYALEINNVEKKYSDFNLDHINIKLPTGSILGFVGENGAGKSTTIKLILDIIKRDEGSITVLGEDNLKISAKTKESIGVVFDDCCFPEVLNLKDVNQVMKGIYKQWDSSIFYQYIKKFRLPETKSIKDYSRGMRMKLSIACALSHHAKLLILDEATSGLDPVVRDEILDVFLEFIQDETNSILISSHIISDLEKICDYICLIHDGHILFSEPKDDLLETYGILKCSESDFTHITKEAVVGYRKNQFGIEALVKKHLINKTNQGASLALNNQYVVDPATIEDIMLFYIKGKR
ncbi:ABC transporter ATP-binding protein [Lachnoclostridium phytofermentans]|uniref:ABC transporter related n=1 Tax=Lachnoclostridium phytofermentans (strain ATCC 700394 / DSM 18823 / ISDg) TaxID=357809 RepID=A9KLA2_LACP7|nr:ABC transporter ATP-binding protein [Lachnoclostridium phytofermentans]ABX44251.1 ABC transporter related [Lachnoclostridium phytofermentans ISDg]